MKLDYCCLITNYELMIVRWVAPMAHCCIRCYMKVYFYAIVCTCCVGVPCALAVMLTVVVLGCSVVTVCLLPVVPVGMMPTTFCCTPGEQTL